MNAVLETERLFLRRFRETDYPDLFEYLSLWEAVKFEPYNPLTPEQCRTEAKNRVFNPNYWAAELKATGKMIGNIYFRQSEPFRFFTWEIGFIFNPKFWRQGYAAEASGRVMRHGFEDLKAHRIVANCDVLNEASFRLMERLGMRREKAALRDIYFRYGADGRPVWKDTYQYALLAEEFFNR